MTTDRSKITDALIARTLAERAGGPDVDLVARIMTATAAVPQRRGLAVTLGLSRRSMVLGVAAVALAVTLAGAAIVGSWTQRPSLVDRPLPGNGAIMAGIDGVLGEVDQQTGRALAGGLRPGQPPEFVTDLAWSPDGTRLAVATDQALSIHDTTSGSDLTPGPCAHCAVAWTLDGTALVIGNGRLISLVDPADGQLISRMDAGGAMAARSGASSVGTIKEITMAPDGRRLAFVALVSGDMFPFIMVIDRDGSNARSLPLATAGDMVIDLRWSPDGATLAYIGSGNSDTNEVRPLEVALLDPGDVRPSRTIEVGACFCGGGAPGLAWSPDGTRLAFTSVFEMRLGLYVAHADGTDIRLITNGATGPIAWRPIPALPPDRPAAR